MSATEDEPASAFDTLIHRTTRSQSLTCPRCGRRGEAVVTTNDGFALLHRGTERVYEQLPPGFLVGETTRERDQVAVCGPCRVPAVEPKAAPQ